jgi:putative uncharacterized protein (fragment)
MANKIYVQSTLVGETGYYKFRRNLGKSGKDSFLLAIMQENLDESPYNDNYGVNRMQLALSERGFNVGIRPITRIMRKNVCFGSLIANKMD